MNARAEELSDRHLATVARQALGRHTVPARLAVGVFEFADTDFGALALVRLKDGKRSRPRWLAAGTDRAGISSETPIRCSSDIDRFLRRRQLRAIGTVDAFSVEAAVEQLARMLTDARDTPSAPAPFSPYLFPVERSGSLLGEDRLALTGRLTAFLRVPSRERDVPGLVAPVGVGKRTAALAVAAGLGLTQVWELPIHRLIAPRVLASPAEFIVDSLVQAWAHPGALLLLTETEMLERVPTSTFEVLLAELRMSGQALLLSSRPLTAPCVRWFELPGLKTEQHVLELLHETGHSIGFKGKALQTLMHASDSPVGVRPGCFLALVELAHRLRGEAPEESPIYPDDAAAAVNELLGSSLSRKKDLG